MANCLRSPSSCGLLNINCISTVGKYSTRVFLPKGIEQNSLSLSLFFFWLSASQVHEVHRSSHMMSPTFCFPLHRHKTAKGFYFMHLQGGSSTSHLLCGEVSQVSLITLNWNLPNRDIRVVKSRRCSEMVLKDERLKRFMLGKVPLESILPVCDLTSEHGLDMAYQMFPLLQKLAACTSLGAQHHRK